ncbi:hypothetical protein B488_05180 [Liberibacter crescens BT-1]|uniref:Uncharacterized protein n=1 Tax=Liberibacter crescens (strain BT-1) TaxID=1215343 RepID=L0EUK5_LIBCB|nr:hypothetical protein [Liberibacter crescens]AGA64510.1 hypothetical protein B488_05180 [Liberibacter crescens BT-1]AMC12665.1 hypothetical protein RL73_02685 [Liberibacter crescens]
MTTYPWEDFQNGTTDGKPWEDFQQQQQTPSSWADTISQYGKSALGALESAGEGAAEGVPIAGHILAPVVKGAIAEGKAAYEGHPIDNFSKDYQSVSQGWDQNKQDHPWANGAGNMGGAIAGTMGLSAMLPVTAPFLMGDKTASLGANMLKQAGGYGGLGLADGTANYIKDKITDYFTGSDTANLWNSAKNALIEGGLGAVGGAAAPVLGKGIGKVSQAITSRIPGVTGNTSGPASADDLRALADNAYGKARDAGVLYSPKATQGLADRLGDEFRNFGYHPELQTGAKVALGHIQDLGGNAATLNDLDIARKIAGNAYRRDDPSNNMLTDMIKNRIDDLVSNPQKGDVLTGDSSQASSSLQEARDYWGRMRKLETVDRLLEESDRNAGASVSRNTEMAARQKIKGLLNNAVKSRGFTPDEKAAADTVAYGKTGQNFIRGIGALAPTNMTGFALKAGFPSLAAGVTMGPTVGGMLGVALPALGYGAKNLSESMTKESIDALRKLIISGGVKAAPVPSLPPVGPIAPATISAIRASLGLNQ